MIFNTIFTLIILTVLIVTYELWFHKDRIGRSYIQMHLDREPTLLDHAVFFFLGTANIHRLLQDWYLGKRVAPWQRNFSWSDLEEFD